MCRWNARSVAGWNSSPWKTQPFSTPLGSSASSHPVRRAITGSHLPHGGRESAQHDWLKNKFAEIARDLGYSAVVEHWPTHADVYIQSAPPFCLEIQLGSTRFEARTRARESRGARVCWLIRDGLNTPSANEALAMAQAVRFRVVDDSRRVHSLGATRPAAHWLTACT